MDHFNITVQDGAMVSTRRGFKVSKQKHNGTAFINSSASNIVPGKKDSGGGSTFPTAGELTFVNNGGDGRRSRRKTRPTSHEGRKTGSRSLGARDNTQHRLSPGIRPSSSSPRTTVSDFTSEYVSSTCSVSSPDHIESTPLPPWAAYSNSPTYIEPTKRLRFMALAFGHRRTAYQEEQHPPAGVRPVDMMQRSTWQVQDPTTIHCALTMGALFDAVKEGKHDTPQLTALASQLYSIVNRRVSDNDRSEKARDVTIRAVASLAIISGYQAKHEHWQVHMRGLLNLVDIAGGQERLFLGTLDMIRCADVVGAISAATRPCTLFVGPHCKSRYASRLKKPGNTFQAVFHCLEEFQFDLELMETLAATAKFCEDYAASHEQDGTPDILEDFHYLTHRLLSIPEPLQNHDKVISMSTSIDLSLHAENLSTSDPTTGGSADTTMKPVERALRILVLMHLKELVLDVPCNDRVLLNLLERQLLLIATDWRSSFFRADQAPVFIWISLASQLFAVWKQDDNTGPRRVSGQLLDMVLNAGEMGTLSNISEDALSFCRCFNLRRIQGATWDEHEAIKRILERVGNE